MLRSTILSIFALPLFAGGPPPTVGMQQNMAMQQNMTMQMLMSRTRRLQAHSPRRQNETAMNSVAPVKGVSWQVHFTPGTPVVVDEELVLGFNGRSLAAHSRADGKLRWETTLEAEQEGSFLLTANLVIIPTEDYRVIALDRTTGKVRFSIQLEAMKRFLDSSNVKTRVQATVEKDRLYIATHGKGGDGEASGKLYAVDLASGSKLWDVPLKAGADYAPIVLDDRIVVGGAPWLQAFSAREGKLHWQVQVNVGEWFMPGIEAGSRYWFTVGRKAVAVDLANGEVVWQGKGGNGCASEGDRVFVMEPGFTKCTLVALAPLTGKRLWEHKDCYLVSPWVQEGMIYQVTPKGLACFQVVDGKEVWLFPLDKRPPCPPMLMGGRLFVVTPDGSKTLLHVLDPKSGKEEWSVTIPVKASDEFPIADAAGVVYPGTKGEVVCLK
ncbi:PQQ-like beta-propeller repeat protein [Geothrix alkalitolerans]|uniref:PQQ-like beta-propeller repeat protein n=1 Tax=Geothrix alkalitolerans TaxID=2922724 RepID=UPI001FAEB0C2|nr:PQQ-like beta-propeller repeat protein [Geothrix alkalitolerans]